MKKHLLLSFLSVATAMQAQDPSKFTDMDLKLPPLQNCAVTFVDFDCDGNMDLIMSGKSGTTGNLSHIYRNNPGESGRTFDLIENPEFTPYNTSLLACADYDNDGFVDLFLGGSDGTEWHSNVFRNENGRFVKLNASFAGVRSGYAVWGDIDNDGYVDLIYTGETNESKNELFIYKNNRGVFQQQEHNLPGAKLGGLSLGDFDGDGYLDLIINGTNVGSTKISKIYKNDGTGNFVLYDEKTIPVNTGAPELWYDFNNDGKLDILFPGTTSSLKTGVYLNEDNTFVKGTEFSSGFTGCVAFAGDLSNNGYNDIITTISEVYLNAGSTFTAMNTGIDKVTLGKIAIADVDNDGKPDLLLTGTTATKPVRIFKNHFAAEPISADAPKNLKSVKNEDGTVTLSWDYVNDQHQHSYNIYLRNTKTGRFLFAPMADRHTGKRFVAQMGNAGLNSSITVKLPLQEADWAWSVQPVSHAFYGGPFAEEIPLVTGDPTGMSQFANKGNIRYDATSKSLVLKTAEVGELKIYDMSGRLVASGKDLAGSFSVAGLQAGVYQVCYQMASGNGMMRIIVRL
ncbi:MAG: T9SS type A sorting domain-containing protein [Bacteroidales bacterium]